MSSTKVLLLISLIFSGAICGYGQNIQLYNADYLPQSLMMNPGADVDYDMHFGVPLLSGIHAKFGSTKLNVDNIFTNDPNSTINERIDDAIFSLTRNDYFTVKQQLEILSAGWRNRKGDYISAGWYQETDMILYFPKDPAVLAYEGNGDYIGRSFNLGDVSGKGELVSVFHLGINKKISRTFSVGARAKLYSSVLNVTSTGNKGRFTTTETPNGNNFYRHTLSNLDLSLKTSGAQRTEDINIDRLISNAFFGGNYGVGLDLGMSYEWNRRWHVTASLVDLGMIFHANETRKISAEGSYEFDGIGFIFPTADEDNTEPPYYQQLENDFKANVPTRNEKGNFYTTLRPVKFYSSMEYRFGEPLDCNCVHPENDPYRFRTGLTFLAVNRPRFPETSLTGYLDARWLSFLHTQVSYTIDPYSLTNLGFLISAQISKFNFYLSADNMLGYQNLAESRTLSLQLGFQFILNSDK